MTQYADQHAHDVFWMGTDERNAYDEALDAIEGYCDYCERSGHTFSSCPKRDDSP